MIIDAYQSQINELTEKVRQLQEEQNIVIKAMDMLQMKFKEHYQTHHIPKKRKLFGFIRK
jgi:4-diphosphocytidyl-2C-methyl-D-erythritol kinase